MYELKFNKKGFYKSDVFIKTGQKYFALMVSALESICKFLKAHLEKNFVANYKCYNKFLQFKDIEIYAVRSSIPLKVGPLLVYISFER